MMTQGVMTQAVNLFGNATGNVTLKGKQANSSFDLMIDSTMKSGSGKVGNTENSTVKKASNQSYNNDNDEKSDVVDGSTKQEKDTTQGITKNEKTKTAAQADNQTQKAEDANQTEDVKNNITEEPTVDETTLEKIAGMLQAVKETVMDLLNLTPEELNQLLTSQGMELVDLLQPTNLQQLVLADSGVSDILTVLTDENLADTLKQLLQSVEDIKAEANLGMSLEQIKNMIDNAELLKEDQKVTSQQETIEVNNNKNQESKPEEAIITSNARQEDPNARITTSGEDKEIQVEVMKVTDAKESSSQSQSDPNKSKNQDLNATEQFEVFMNNLTKASTSTQVDFNGNLVQTTEIREIANQIIQRIRVTIQPEQTSMELQLNPENLGKVNLSVQSKNGVMTAQFVVQNEISREAIESQLHTLRETLNQQGIKVEAIEVTVATYSFEQNNKENTDGQAESKTNHSGSKISLDEALTMTEETEVASSQEITDIRGSQIDYTA
jgi:flagellar hook-length control protein FliK